MTLEELLLDPPTNWAVIETRDRYQKNSLLVEGAKIARRYKTIWTIKRRVIPGLKNTTYRVHCVSTCPNEKATWWMYEWRIFVDWLRETDQVILNMVCW